ncbi:MAG: 3-deoxy-D-manno-octulosonic acid transferase [Verrucomicrobia bacterium]|nr:3-deoxy-D-manno-octulosonic acid transferase [Verrucomicrobiota bacterium]
MRFLYNILFTLFLVITAPFYFLKMWRRGNWRERFGERFGSFEPKVKQALTNRNTLWLHAVSVGEVNICTHLIQSLQPRLPNLKLVVSTTTSTGMGELKKRLPTHILKIYYPIDRRLWTSRSLATIHPEAVILVEAEIWPNFLWRCRDMGIPVFLINARLSERSLVGYRIWGFLFRPLFAGLAGVGCQNEADAEKLRKLGCRPEAIHVLGSLKFDAVQIGERRLTDTSTVLKQMGVGADQPILVAGSTHAGEEALIGKVILALRARHPNLFLVVVPRHAERSKQAGNDLEGLGLRVAYRTELTQTTQHAAGSKDCLIVNTTGELKDFYKHASLIFVGKSLRAHGGQNPIEPGALGKAMLFGPNMENFRAIADAFLAAGGAVQVKDPRELEQTVDALLDNPARREEMGKAALKVVQENKGAMDRTVEMIVEQLKDRRILVK